MIQQPREQRQRHHYCVYFAQGTLFADTNTFIYTIHVTDIMLHLVPLDVFRLDLIVQ